MRLRTICGLAAIAATLCAGPTTGSAQTLPSPAGPHAILYELTENLKVFRNRDLPPRRIATAALGGFASEGTPICPPEAVDEDGFCNVNVIGSDNISTRTFRGSLHGEFAVTRQGDNPFDGPEAVVMQGRFSGRVDLSAAFEPVPSPIGLVDGLMAVNGGGAVPFRGVFRLPFPCGPVIAYLATDRFGNPIPPFCDPVKPTETLFGRPMVRLDIWFE